MKSVWDHLLEVSEETGIPYKVITGRNQTKPVMAARKEVIKRCILDGYSHSMIGRLIGRDRTTVTHHADF